jgi:hypothetical protein
MVNLISFGPSGINSQADFSPLAQLGPIYQKAQQDAANKAAFAAYQQTGDPSALLASGGMNLARLGTELARNKVADVRDARDFSFRQTEAQRAQQNADRSYGLQARTADRADEEKFGIKEVTDPNTGATSFVKYNLRTGEVSPTGTAATATPSQPNNPFSTGGKFNNEQGKAAGFTDRMLQSEGILSGVAVPAGSEGPPMPGVQEQGTSRTQGTLSGVWGVGNYLTSTDRKKFEQAKRDFINAQLRRESGAAIQPSEFESADKQYFPVPGDPPELIAQKALNRRAAIEAMGREGGQAYRPKSAYNAQGVIAPYGSAAPPTSTASSAAAAPALPPPPKQGELRDGYRFKGGNPGDPANWAKAQN